MSNSRIIYAPAIRLKSPIPPEDQTEKRDTAAEYIKDMWPATLTEIAAATDEGFTRQHISTTLKTYFEPVWQTEHQGFIAEPDAADVGESVAEAHQRGWQDGYRQGWRDAQDDDVLNQLDELLDRFDDLEERLEDLDSDD